MALIAQRGRLIRELKGLYLFLGVRSTDRLVAGIAGFRRWMDIFGFEHARMAFGGHAALFRRSIGHRGQINRKKRQYDEKKRSFIHRLNHVIIAFLYKQ
jgi:hypothetical protein